MLESFFWLAPNQVAIATVTNKVDGYAAEVAEQLENRHKIYKRYIC